MSDNHIHPALQAELLTPAEFAALVPIDRLRPLARLLLQDTPAPDAAEQKKDAEGHEAA